MHKIFVYLIESIFIYAKSSIGFPLAKSIWIWLILLFFLWPNRYTPEVELVLDCKLLWSFYSALTPPALPWFLLLYPSIHVEFETHGFGFYHVKSLTLILNIWDFMLLKLFKKVNGCMSDSQKLVYFWEIRHGCSIKSEESAQLRWDFQFIHRLHATACHCYSISYMLHLLMHPWAHF